jgi:uncharacterized Fe-S cluster protein YjdI
LQGDDVSENDQSGRSVAISGDTIVIGAHQDDDACPSGEFCNSGSAYVFVLSEQGWIQQAKLTADDAEALDVFGWDVDIDGDTVVVGARSKDNQTGAAYIFERDGEAWDQTHKLLSTDPDELEQFGVAVAIDGDTIAVGARNDGDLCAQGDAFCNTGSIYIFESEPESWTFTQRITSHQQMIGDNFGAELALCNDRLAVGADAQAASM